MVHRLPYAGTVENRSDIILEQCTGREVLHLGCVDSGTVEPSFDDGTLLHLQLLRVAKRVVGLDIDEQGLAFLRMRGVPDLIHWDLERLEELQLDRPVEVIVAGEVLEHLANPGLCLRGMRRLMAGPEAIAVVTVPNAFSLRHFIPVALRRTELVLPDHTAYFSPTTLAEILKRSGLGIRKMYMYTRVDKAPSRTKRIVKHAMNLTVFRLNPFLAEGIIAIAGKA